MHWNTPYEYFMVRSLASIKTAYEKSTYWCFRCIVNEESTFVLSTSPSINVVKFIFEDLRTLSCQTLKLPQKLVNCYKMPSIDELECGCCCELLCNPTTLTCGHSFCRYCLAKWFVTSNKPECPLCRQTWSGFPQVNITLRWSKELLNPWH